MHREQVIDLLRQAHAELEAQQPLNGTLQRGKDRWRYVVKLEDGRQERRYVRQADRDFYQRRVRLGQAMRFVEKAMELLGHED